MALLHLVYGGDKTIERESFSHFAIMIKSNMFNMIVIYSI